MDDTVAGRLERLHAAWQEAWTRCWTDVDRRADLVDLYCWTRAVSLLVDGSGDTSELWVPSAAGLVHDVVAVDLGRTVVAPVAVVAAGVRVVAERSRPGWHLRGVVDAVECPGDAEALLVLAVDEGDNEVVTLVDVDAPGVTVERSGDRAVTVRLDDVPVADDALVHRPDTRAALVDRLTVLRLVDVLDSTTHHGPEELVLVRAAVLAAGRSAATAAPLTRQHDVSVAAVLALPAGARRDWHRERLVPLI